MSCHTPYVVLQIFDKADILSALTSKTEQSMTSHSMNSGHFMPKRRLTCKFKQQFFLRFCRTCNWTKRYLITLQTNVKRVSRIRIYHSTIHNYLPESIGKNSREDCACSGATLHRVRTIILTVNCCLYGRGGKRKQTNFEVNCWRRYGKAKGQWGGEEGEMACEACSLAIPGSRLSSCLGRLRFLAPKLHSPLPFSFPVLFPSLDLS